MSTEKNRSKRERRRRRDGKQPVSQWHVIEGVVAALERHWHAKHPDARITRRAMVEPCIGTRRREVDVLIRVQVGHRDHRTGAEVKHEQRPLSVVKVEQACAKLNSLKLDTKVIVSTSGFAASAKEKAQEMNVQLSTLTEIKHVTPPPWLNLNNKVRMTAEPMTCLGYTPFWGEFALDRPPDQPADLMEPWQGANSAEVIIVGPEGDLPLSAVLQFNANKVKGDFLPKIEEWTEYHFPVPVRLSPDEGVKAIRYRDRELPIPTGVVGVYRVERIDKEFDIQSFHADGALAQASVVELLGQRSQLNVVTTTDGWNIKVNMSFDEIAPKPTTVE